MVAAAFFMAHRSVLSGVDGWCVRHLKLNVAVDVDVNPASLIEQQPQCIQWCRSQAAVNLGNGAQDTNKEFSLDEIIDHSVT